jgi:hypothetical protein
VKENRYICKVWKLYYNILFLTDINECLEQTGTCPPPGNCINTLGSFKCICPRGFKLDSTGTFCTDADECTDDSKCPYGYGCQVNL